MAKRYYRFSIHGYGGEIVLGRLTEEQYDFWQPMDEETIISHAMWDPYEESDENPIFDDEDPRFLGSWHELDDIEHVNGATSGSAWVTLEELDNLEYNANILNTLVENMDWKDFLEQYKPQVHETSLDLDDELYPNGFYEEDDPDGEEGEPKPLDNGDIPTPYVFFGMSAEKGTFSECDIESDGELDITKLNFSILHMPNDDAILSLTDYDNEPVCDQGGGTNGKGYYAEIWDW
jgi:hypothetical protein